MAETKLTAPFRFHNAGVRIGLVILSVASPMFAFAGGSGVAGTRLGGDYTPSSSASTGIGFGALTQMILALAIVAFLLKWVLPRIAGKLTKKLVTSPEGGILVEESAQFAGGSLYIISARGKSLLVSVAGTSVTTLGDLTQPAQSKPDPFEAALAEAQSRPPMTPAELQARAALDRLSHLSPSHALR